MESGRSQEHKLSELGIVVSGGKEGRRKHGGMAAGQNFHTLLNRRKATFSVSSSSRGEGKKKRAKFKCIAMLKKCQGNV